jgi:HTH-type transcriptional regulator/antitoxin HigA
MAVKKRHTAMPDSYFALVRRFPLTHIRDRRHLSQAMEVVDELLQRKLDRGSQEYLDALSDLVASFEEEHTFIPDASESDVVRELWRSSGHTQVQLAKLVGIA